MQATSESDCPACMHLASFMQVYIEKTVNLLTAKHDEFLQLFKESKGLCIPHFAQLIRAAETIAAKQNQEILSIMADVEKQGFLQIHSELAKYIERQSYKYSNQKDYIGGDAVFRSVKKIAGRKSVKVSTKIANR
ncbi:MAG: DUF6062 family protein [Candidatus Bathyarchaeia archaeon]